jgi:DNA-binding NarL/FixJ family response regulator
VTYLINTPHSLTAEASIRNRRRIFFIDDHPLIRKWLANVIDQQRDLMVCGHINGRGNCIEAIERSHADVVVIDISQGLSSSFHLIAEIKSRLPRIKIIAITLRDSPSCARQALLAGATGYIVEREAARKICKAIHSVLRGGTYGGHEAAPTPEPCPVSGDVDFSPLSDRETQIFYFLGLGRTTRQIADSLGISIKTVQIHCRHIREKLRLEGAIDLLNTAIRWNQRQEMEEGQTAEECFGRE